MRWFLYDILRSRRVNIICRLSLAVVFALAAVGKILDPLEFSDAVAAFRILPITWTNIFAITLPWIELFAAVILLMKRMSKSSGFILALLNIIFVAAISSAMARGLDIECGCFTLSKAHDKVGWGLLARDCVLLALCLEVVFVADEKITRKSNIADCLSV